MLTMWATDRDHQNREAEQLFAELTVARPAVAMVLMHNLQILVLAYLPGRGTHRFPPLITPDLEFEEHWRGWTHTR